MLKRALILVLALLLAPVPSAMATDFCDDAEAVMCITGNLDGGTGSAISDETSFGHDGEFEGNSAWVAAYPTITDGGTYSMDFDGSSDDATFGSPDDLDNIFSGDATVAHWVYVDAYGENSTGHTISKFASSTAGWKIMVDDTGSYGSNTKCINFTKQFSGGRRTWQTPTDSIAAGGWFHVAVVYNGSSSANDPIIYIDGVSQSLDRFESATGTDNTDASATLYVGNSSDVNRSIDAKITQLLVTKKLLSESEVNDAMDNGINYVAGPGGGGGDAGGAIIVIEEN